MENGIISGAKDYVENFFKDKVAPEYTYHNFQHTLRVFTSVLNIGRIAEINDDDIELLQLAALFHDTGFSNGPVDHESRSAKIAAQYLNGIGYEAEKIEKISALIKATSKGYQTEDQLELIMRDADLSGLAGSNYQVESLALKNELEFMSNTVMSEKDWHSMNYEFIKNHEYNTEAAKTIYKTGKKINLKYIKKKLADLNRQKSTISTSKSAQTQFKTALRNHIDLSAIADNKANIMLSVNALIITVALPVIANQVLENNALLIPAIILLIVCVTSMVYATLATRPIKMSGFSSQEDIKSNKSNLFFFGNFFKMKYSEYAEGIETVVQDADILDSSITRDLFFLGKSLGAKYTNLRICYNIFMYGIIVVVIAFVIAFVISASTPTIG